MCVGRLLARQYLLAPASKEVLPDLCTPVDDQRLDQPQSDFHRQADGGVLHPHTTQRMGLASGALFGHDALLLLSFPFFFHNVFFLLFLSSSIPLFSFFFLLRRLQRPKRSCQDRGTLIEIYLYSIFH